MEITENHAASSSQLHLQAVWHVAKLQVHGRGQVAIKSVVLWGNVTLHKDDEESEVHARSLSHPAMQTHLLKLLAHGCEHRHPAVLDLGLTTPASAQMLAKLKCLKTSNISSNCFCLQDTASASTQPLEDLKILVLGKTKGVPEADRCLVTHKAFEASVCFCFVQKIGISKVQVYCRTLIKSHQHFQLLSKATLKLSKKFKS